MDATPLPGTGSDCSTIQLERETDSKLEAQFLFEKQEWIRLTSSEKKLIAEKKILLLEDLPFRGPKDEKGERPSGK